MNEAMSSPPKPPRAEPNAVDLVRAIGEDSALLVKQEVELLKREIAERIDRAQLQAAVLAGGGLVAFLGVMALVASATIALAEVVPIWAAPLIVGSVLVALGAVLVWQGKRSLESTSLEPTETKRRVERDVAAVRSAT